MWGILDTDSMPSTFTFTAQGSEVQTGGWRGGDKYFTYESFPLSATPELHTKIY